MTVPGVSPLVLASLRGQKEAVVALKTISTLSFMVLIAARHLLLVELEGVGAIDAKPPACGWLPGRRCMRNIRVRWGAAAERQANGSWVCGFVLVEQVTSVWVKSQRAFALAEWR